MQTNFPTDGVQPYLPVDGDGESCLSVRPNHLSVEASELSPTVLYLTIKRLADVTISLALIILASPLLLSLMLLVKLSSKGPVLYSQVRLGRDRRPFRILKIRTMYHNCERLSGPKWSTEDDPRVTTIGRFLRRTHLDELPQLWNILVGEMSLVGPRPERPEFVGPLEKVLPRYGERLLVPPGLTGLAQVNLPPDTDQESVRRKLALDLEYVENLSLWLDLRLLMATGLFLIGVPFAASTRLLGLASDGEGDSVRSRSAEPVGAGVGDCVSNALPAWRDI